MRNAELERPINGLSRSREHSALCALHSAFCTRRCARATALIETAIVLPLYMILLFGLLYFGYATLGRQRQDKATSYAAWQSAPQQASSLVGPGPFWSWNEAINTGTVNPALPNSSSAIFGDTTFSVYGGSATHQWIRQSDEYYGMTINGTIPIPCQLEGAIHSLSGGGSDLFDSERVAVDLWNFALGSTTQSFTWTPGLGLVQNFNTSYTSFARYLNIDANPQSGGLLHADDGTPPTLLGPDGMYAGLTCAALNGAPNGSPGAGPWLQRRAVESTMTYNDPLFLRHAYAEQDASPSTFGQYISGNDATPNNPTWQTATMDCDVTIRNSASVRQGAEEPPQTADALLAQVSGFLSQSQLAAPNSMDSQILNSSGTTIQAAWTPW